MLAEKFPVYGESPPTSRGLYVIIKKRDSPEEVAFILGKNMTDKMKTITVGKIVSALSTFSEGEQNNILEQATTSLQVIEMDKKLIHFVTTFVDKVSNDTVLHDRYNKLGKFIYPKPTQVWPFNSCFHDPITVWYALCPDVFTTHGGGGLIPLSSLRLSSEEAILQEMVFVGKTEPIEVETIIRKNSGDEKNYNLVLEMTRQTFSENSKLKSTSPVKLTKENGNLDYTYSLEYKVEHFKEEMQKANKFDDVWLYKCKKEEEEEHRLFNNLSFTLKSGGTPPNKGNNRRFFTARLFTTDEASSVDEFVKTCE